MGGFQGLLQRFGVLQVLAVADDDLLAGDADLADLLHQEADHAFTAPGLAADLDFSLVAARADAPEAQVAGDEADQAADPAGLDQVMIGGKGEAGMDPVRGFVQVFFNLLNGFALEDQVPGAPDQHGFFRTGGPGVNDDDLLVRFILQQHIPAEAGAVVAAGQGAGNREGDHRTGSGKLFPPDFRGRAGRLGHFAMSLIGLQHIADRHVFIIHKFFAADPDGERNRGEVHFSLCALQLIQVTGRVSNQVPH